MRDRLPRLISSMMKTWGVSGLARARSQKRWKTPGLRVNPPFVGGAEALDEVLVGVRLVELDHLDGVVVLVADQAPGDPAGDEGLPGAGRALEDEVLAAPEGGEEAVEVGGGDEEVAWWASLAV